MAGKVSIGDFVRIEFTGRRKSSGTVFDTTDEDEAKEAGIHSEKAVYGPVLVVVGKGMVIAGLDGTLQEMEIGGSRNVEIPPEKGYGLRNPALVRVMPLAEFRKRDIEPHPGMVIDLDGAPAIVRSVTSGRVMVDLNHALSGETIIFDVKLTEKVEGTEAKAKALLENNRLTADKVKFENGELEIRLPPADGPQDVNVFVAKAAFIRAVKELLPEIKNVEVGEKYLMGEKKPEG